VTLTLATLPRLWINLPTARRAARYPIAATISYREAHSPISLSISCGNGRERAMSHVQSESSGRISIRLRCHHMHQGSPGREEGPSAGADPTIDLYPGVFSSWSHCKVALCQC
jgi:hypothetical protein